jgi:hypothetical protein
MDFGIAETGIARGSPPGTTTKVLRVGFPSEEIRVVSDCLREDQDTKEDPKNWQVPEVDFLSNGMELGEFNWP